MSVHRSLFKWRWWWMMALAVFVPVAAPAHGAFDHNIRAWIFEDHLEVTVTLGPEAARVFLNHGPEAALHSGQMTVAYPLPAETAARLFEIQAGGTVLIPAKSTVRSDGIEFDFGIFYPRPAAGALRLDARYLAELPALAKGSMVVVDENGQVVAGKILSPTETSLEFSLTPGTGAPTKILVVTNSTPAPGAAATGAVTVAEPAPIALTTAAPVSAPVAPSFAEFIKLGIEHILTGFDHLLFLTALLVTIRQVKPMLVIITCFTLAHSVTLGLAATNIVFISPRIVEPVIAASIIVVGLENLWRREATHDRYWLAGGFGLIHGFGFAGALRETGLGGNGLPLVLPLLGFNLGVELGQLAVAALVVPLLLWLRNVAAFARFGTPAISTAVVIISSYWFFERVFFYR
ncbi:MAG: HupE/UreJ family protein [Verrucomicrobiota bacterium]